MLKRLTLFITAALTGLMIALPAPASAALLDSEVKKEACAGLSATTDGKCDAEADKTVGNLIKTAINILSWVAGIIAIIMLIVGGLKYITSAGESNNVNSAKNTILYAIIGLVIVFFTQVIIRFVIGRASSGT
jgi:hypothetical protein